MKHYYNIAGLTVSMESFGRTVEQAKPYACFNPETVDIEVVSNWELVKPNHPNLSDDDGEYLATGASFYRNLLNHDGMLLHSSAVVVDGFAYLFSANSGTGKSTHTGLWLKQFGDAAYILNDDKPALRRVDGVWYAYGTPWSGKHNISSNVGVPVGGIAILERGNENQIQRCSGEDVVYSLFLQVNRPRDAHYRIKLLDLLDKLMTQVPVWKLRCNMEPEAAVVAYEAMSGQKWRR